MFDPILIISDNPTVFNKFYARCQRFESLFNFTFGTTCPEKRPEFIKKVEIFDLNDLSKIHEIVNNYELVLSLHCKQIFPAIMIDQVLCVNIHPGYLPLNRGWYPHVFSIIKGIDTGATIHEMTKSIDKGPIIAREKVKTHAWDTSKSLYDRIVEKELKMIEKHLPDIISGRYSSFWPDNEDSHFFSKQDYEDLKNVELSNKASKGEVIDYLRAMSHDDYKNAYFIDPQSGDKVYLSLSLEKCL